jgi:hypothetical protein
MNRFHVKYPYLGRLPRRHQFDNIVLRTSVRPDTLSLKKIYKVFFSDGFASPSFQTKHISMIAHSQSVCVFVCVNTICPRKHAIVAWSG